MAEVREHYFQDGQWHESTAHSGQVVGPVREPSPDDEPMHDITVRFPSRLVTASSSWDVDLFDAIAEVAYAWEAEQGERDGWDVEVHAGPSLEGRLAAVTRERDEARRMLAQWDEKLADWQARFHEAEARAAKAEAAVARVEALCTERDYTTWDQNDRLGEPPWRSDDPRVIAWERNHGHDVRTKCYPEYGCLLLLDPSDVLAALVGDTDDA